MKFLEEFQKLQRAFVQNPVCSVKRSTQIFDLGLLVTVLYVQIRGMILNDVPAVSGATWDGARTGPSQPLLVSLPRVILIQSHRVGISSLRQGGAKCENLGTCLADVGLCFYLGGATLG